jgi:hypothetical protein
MEIASQDSKREFSETFGYIRQDLAAIPSSNVGLNCTIALPACCGCEMLAWHRGVREANDYVGIDNDPLSNRPFLPAADLPEFGDQAFFIHVL